MKTFLVFTLFIFTFIDSFSQHQIKHYDIACSPPGYDYGRSIINRIDKGYAIAGYSYQIPACIGSYEWMFLKLKADGTVDCAKLLGIGQDDKCYSLIQSATDSAYVMAGYTTNTAVPFYRKATVMRVDKNCGFPSAVALSDSLNSVYNQVIKDPSDVRAFTGYVETHITVGYKRNKILVSQRAPTGVFTWANRYVIPGLSKEEAYSICFQPLGSCYGVAAKTNFFSGSPSVNEIMLVKLNYFGAVIWNFAYKILLPAGGSYPNTEPRKIIAMPDGGFVVVGFTNAYGSTQRDIIVFRVNAAGGLMWSNTYGASGLTEIGESIVHISPHLVLTGSVNTVSPAGPPNAFIMKIPEVGGAPLWTRVWDAANPTDAGYDIINSMTGTTTAGFAVTGHTSRPGVSTDPFLWRTNSAGLIPGTTCNDSIVTPCRPNAHLIESCPLNPIPVTHTNRPCTEVNPPAPVVTLCLGTSAAPLEGNYDSENSEVNEFSLRQNSPNPFNPSTTINFELPVSGFTKLKVFDAAGRLVSTLVNELKETGLHSVTFNGSELSSGVYYYKIETDGFTDIKKMILIK